MAYSKETQRLLLRIQQSEMTEAAAYHAMASSIKDGHNRETLGKIADEIAVISGGELTHQGKAQEILPELMRGAGVAACCRQKEAFA